MQVFRVLSQAAGRKELGISSAVGQFALKHENEHPPYSTISGLMPSNAQYTASLMSL